MAKKSIGRLESELAAAKKRIGQYMAITGICDYTNVAEFSSLCGYLKGHVPAATEYFIGKGWMNGIALRAAYQNGTCAFLTPLQSAVIANTTIDEFEHTVMIAEKVHESNRYHSKFKPDFILMTRALNCYCRANPDTLYLFPEIEDFPLTMPSEDEMERAREMWEAVKIDLQVCKSNTGTSLFEHLFTVPAFMDFMVALPANTFMDLFRNSILRYWNMEFITDELFDYMMKMLDALTKTTPSKYCYKYSDALLYQHFFRHGDIDWHLDRMHSGTDGHMYLTIIKALQEERPGDAVKVVDAYLKPNKELMLGDPFCNIMYGLTLYLDKSPSSLKKAEALLKRKLIKESATIPAFRLLLQMKAHPETDFESWISANLYCTHTTHIEAAMFSLICTHFNYHQAYKDVAKKYANIFVEKDMKMLSYQFAKDIFGEGELAERLQHEVKMKPLLPEFKILEPWEIVLNTMMTKFDANDSTTTVKKASPSQEMGRVSYELNTVNYVVQPRLQKSKNGGATWSSGRNIALKTFQKGIPEMTSQDARIALLIETYQYGWYGETSMTLGGENVVEALIGHPYVYDSRNPELKIEIQADKLQIQVKETRDGFSVTSNVKEGRNGYSSISVHQENAQLIKVIRLTADEKEMLTLFDRIKVFPKESKEKLTKLLSALGRKVTVMSSLLKNTQDVKQKKGDTKLTMQLVPYGDMFTARCFVKPLTDCPPYCTPGKGLEYIAATVKGKVVQVARNLTAERKHFQALTEWMEPFGEYESGDGWQMPMESCLEVLDLLREHSDICHIEWPEGVRFSVARPALSPDSIHLSVKGIGHWFEISGEVSIDEKQEMKISELLKRVREAKGRFIQVGDAEYMAISKQLHSQLSALDRMMQSGNKHLRLATYNSPFLKGLADIGADLKVDKSYTQMMQRMDEADTMKITVPKSLQADLRDYQVDGYRWLCRLAHWGAGACLADDMGLGKTIQTIALLLARAKEGASLVVMPTSVLINWKNELARFAPLLNPIILRESSDRADAISKAGAQDVVLITYGLLPTEEEALCSKAWNVIVLDEAHTIKNKETKTSKAAMQLDGKFRLLLTGTPLQNHLSEIWNLFQFATPGLLTGYAQFTQEFINPIEKENNKDTQRLLKRMLQPFILRRTKNEVLNELPEKTEITLKVELSDDERALYDRFRQEAILNLEEGSTSAIKALAELTRLRQTACNAALVLPEKEAKAIPSSKMDAFLKLVDELISNHHRALVFSQFTSHLALVEKELKKQNIDYQYLDGSVAPQERIARVSEFQKGDMPLFLISLKAGGTGLNLTAADYVIHLDPWWNPAIEDQASDRAYRIGQDKPVTVYRIIAENTIEEKIIALHQTKKSLADALLEGSDMAYALGKDEILSLIRGVE